MSLVRVPRAFLQIPQNFFFHKLSPFGLTVLCFFTHLSLIASDTFHSMANISHIYAEVDETLVILPKTVNKTEMSISYQEFQKAQEIPSSLLNSTVYFENYEDLTSVKSYLLSPHYKIIIYLFNQDIDWNFNSFSERRNVDLIDVEVCDVISNQYSLMYNKTVILWPCYSTLGSKTSSIAYKSVPFAVKHVFQKLDWRSAVIFATGSNLKLSLNIAEHLHLPYRIKIGLQNLETFSIKDHEKKILVITSSLGSRTTNVIFKHYKNLHNTQVLIVDLMSGLFDLDLRTYHKVIQQTDFQRVWVLTLVNEELKALFNLMFPHFSYSKQYNNSERQATHQNMMASLSEVNNNICNWTSFATNKTIRSLLDQNRLDCEVHLKQFCDIRFNELINVWKTKVKHWCTMMLKFYSTGTLSKHQPNFPTSNKENFFYSTFLTDDNDSFKSPIQNNFRGSNGTFFDYDGLFKTIFTNTIISKISYKEFVLLEFRQKQPDFTGDWTPRFWLQQNKMNADIYTIYNILDEPSNIGSSLVNDLLENSAEVLSVARTCGAFCWILIVVITVLLCLIVFGSILIGISVRNCLLKKRLSKGPNKLVLSASDFVFPVDSRRVDEGIEAMLCCWLQQLQEFGGPEVEKPDLLKGSIGSLKNFGLATVATKNNSGSGSLARHNTLVDLRARYNGDIVQLKEVISSGTVELKAKAMDNLLMAHTLRHENINPLIGWLSDAQRSAMVFENCSRGSLQDVLIMDEIKLDWSFRLSLLTDLVRGMRYLHSSPIKYHGALSSRNCVVDARWVLKITDYGVPAFYEAQGLPLPIKTSKQLLWTAPELLRNQKGTNKGGTQAGDVYSFGIIMQEVVVRGEPYCMLSSSPDDIIAKIKKPPPLIRPSVSKGAAPPEAINIMRQCWAENPEMRPDFTTICERFKQLNQGRKVNFVDTMFQMLEKYSNNLEELIRERTEQLEMERKKTEQLLNRMLPSSVAEKLKMGEVVEPEEFSDVTIYFSDIVGFTTIAAHCTAVQVVDLLNDLYTCFDATINAYNVYKVETIGDAYMVVSGLPVPIADHVEQIATMALDLLHHSGTFEIRHLPGVPLQLRIGLHTGPCCAGVVGLTMPRYCLFGDTVNTASRMESTGSSWRIHMSEVTKERLEKAGGYIIEPRGPIEIKGKGVMKTYWLLGKKGFNKTLPCSPPVGESHGLDESLIRNSILTKEGDSNRLSVGNSSSNPSSSHSPSVSGEQFDVKVEITPAPPIFDSFTTNMSKSSTIESASNMNLSVSEFSMKTNTPSPQQRKFSEIPEYVGLLGAMSNMNRMCQTSSGPTANANSSKMFKKIEDIIDLSSPYNHYKCLSPSETNLNQCPDAKSHAFYNRLETSKPGSGRLLRRQFSLDKDDAAALQQSNRLRQLEKVAQDINSFESNVSGKKMQTPATLKVHKQQSISNAQDLEKIEEVPVSPKCLETRPRNIDENIV